MRPLLSAEARSTGKYDSSLLVASVAFSLQTTIQIVSPMQQVGMHILGSAPAACVRTVASEKAQ